MVEDQYMHTIDNYKRDVVVVGQELKRGSPAIIMSAEKEKRKEEEKSNQDLALRIVNTLGCKYF